MKSGRPDNWSRDRILPLANDFPLEISLKDHLLTIMSNQLYKYLFVLASIYFTHSIETPVIIQCDIAAFIQK